MAQVALFLNGVYRDVLEDIVKVQRWLPELVLYLQPYKKEPIKRFQANPPTVQNPTKFYTSTTDDQNSGRMELHL